MTLFRLLLIIITLLIILKLFHKILVKRNIVEGITNIDKKNEMDKLNSVYGTGIKLSPYNLKNSADRPVPISPSVTAANVKDVALKAQYQASLVATETNMSFLPVIQPPPAPPTPPASPTPPTKPGTNLTKKSSNEVKKQWEHYNTQAYNYNFRKQSYKIVKLKFDANNKIYINKKALYDDYIKRRNDFNIKIAQYKQSITTVQTRINNYNNAVATYKMAFDDYTRINDDNNHLNFRLKDLAIKSSYNSAFTGTCMNTDMITFVLKRGCRYIDFEIRKIDDILYVSSDSLEKENSITLIDAIGSINKSLIGTDPLFINLRLKSPTTINYADLQAALSPLTKARLRYTGRSIDNTTRISEVMNKCVVISDHDIKSSTGVSVADMVINENSIRAYLNSEIKSLAPTGESNRLTVVYPNNMRSGLLSWLDPEEANMKLLVMNYKVNIIPHRFYLKSGELDAYEYIFNDNTHTMFQLKYLDKAFFEKMEKSMDKIGQNIS